MKSVPTGKSYEEILRYPEVADFVSYLRLKNLSSRTIVEYMKALRGLFRWLNQDDGSPTTITTAQLRAYLSSLMEKGRTPKTISNYTIVIKRFFGFLCAEGYIEEDPSRRLPNPKIGKRLPRALTLEQVQALLSVFDKDSPLERRDRVLIYLMYACGLRISEAVAVRGEDIDLEQGTLRVVGKGDKERSLYLKPVVVGMLRCYMAGTKPQDYLFPGRFGGHITDRNIHMRFKRYAGRAGLPEDVSPHALRHSIAVHYLLERAPLPFVQNLLGHASLATTGIYTQLADSMTKDIALNTKTALDDLPRRGELRERGPVYVPDAGGWAFFVVEVLDWLYE